MNRQILNFETLEREMVCALRFIDGATGKTIREAVHVSAPGVKLFRKSNGDVIILESDGSAVKTLDIQPATPDYLPRRYALNLPRPGNAGDAGSIFEPVELPLYPSTTYPITGNAATLHITVKRKADAKLIAGALVRIVRADKPSFIAKSITNTVGEALIIVGSAPLTVQNGGNPTRVIDAQLDILVAENDETYVAESELSTARRRILIVNPDELEANRLTLGPKWKSVPVELWAGGFKVVEVLMEPP